MVTRLTTYLSFVRFSHSVFALPFALAGALLAARQSPLTWATVAWILVAMVAARSAAMGFNRLVDARFDALNPRTANRELPRGAMIHARGRRVRRRRRRSVFVYAAWRLNPLCFAAVAGRARHRVLVFAGEALHDLDAAVPRPRDGGRAGRRLARGRRTRRLGAVAAGAGDRRLGRRLRRPLCVPGPRVRSRARPALDSGAVRRADRRWRFPARCTWSTVVCLLALGAGSRRCRGSITRASARSRLLLVYEQSLVRADDLSQVKRAFDLNGYVGILYLVVLAVSLWRA